MASDPIARQYPALTPPERFALTIEAMARGDEADADRLEQTCPKLNYHMEDQEFRDRMRRVYLITLMVCLNMRQGLGQIRAAVAFAKVSDAFAHGPTLAVQGAFLFGRVYARWEANGGECEDIPARAALQAELERCPDLKTQMEELKGVAELAMGQVADTLTYSIGVAYAADLLSQWEGFGRFCRQYLSVEPLTLLRALRLGEKDPAAEVLAVYADAKADEAKAEEWAANWRREWARRFGGNH
jgi:hypothetical protein